MSEQEQPIVIIGSGLAGYSVAREFRKRNTSSAVVMISRDHGGFYSKPMLSNALATGKSTQSLLNADAVKMAKQLNIDIQPNAQVESLAPAQNALILQGGEVVPYSQLVLAVGADPIRLPLDGDGAAHHIISVNDLDDYHLFRERLDGKSVVIILGAGLIGCEFANDLATAGYRVHLIDISARPLGRLLPEAGGSHLQQKLEAVGVIFHLNTSARRVDMSAGRFHLTVERGEVIVGDLVLSAVGLHPRTELAQAAGLEVNRGIVVNRLLQTCNTNIFALGDCAEVDGRVLPFVMPIMHAARALAATLVGTPTPVHYPAMPISVKLPACSVVVSPPDVRAKGDWAIQEDALGVRALFRSADGNLLGYALLGEATQDKAVLTAQLPPTI